ncbi:MAG: hypothetical protein AUK35_06235 [Zetaproteobacteria bacterium CG2_30_46_52]|nr:MAG: hypothetical protein AUK35_06235 [Zetaproteobacteria bacterium CG2_30_46_52]
MGNPVRKTKVRTRGVRGRFYSHKVGRLVRYESLNEKYLLKVLEVDPYVSTYCEQPLEIDYSYNGKFGTYTPDVLSTNIYGQKTLFEAKSQSELDKADPRLEAKFIAAHDYCTEHNWDFKIVTESIKESLLFARADIILPHLMHPGLSHEKLGSLMSLFETSSNIAFESICPNMNWNDENYRYLLHLIGLGKLIEEPFGVFDSDTVIKVFAHE